MRCEGVSFDELWEKISSGKDFLILREEAQKWTVPHLLDIAVSALTPRTAAV